MQIEINLLGRFEALDSASHAPIVFPRKKAAALLAFLAMPAGCERSREDIADMFWGYTGESGARNSLRQTLLVIRKTVPDFRGLKAAPHSLLLLPDHVTVDVNNFELASNDASLQAQEHAANLYAGSFLYGFSLREDRFERWRADEAARLQDTSLSVFERLMVEYLALGRHDDAAKTSSQTLSIDPLHEGAHQTLIRVYSAQGRFGLARRQYDVCRKLLAKELGIKPSHKTEGIYTAITGQRSSAFSPPAATYSAPIIATDFSSAPVVVALPFEYSGANSQSLTVSIAPKLIAVMAAALPLRIVDHRSVSVAAGRTTPTMNLANRFGARYAVEGSVRFWKGRWRIDFSLVDAITGRHLFTSSCERVDADLFQLADRFALHIGTKTAYQIEYHERVRAAVLDAGKMDAWVWFNRGMALLEIMSHKDIIPAQSAFARALEIEPRNARATAGLADGILQEGICLVGKDRQDAYAKSLDKVQQAHALDRDDPYVNLTLGRSYQRVESHDLALESLQSALEVTPENLETCVAMGNLLAFMGMPEKGIPLVMHSPSSANGTSILARSYLQMGNYPKAYDWSERAIRIAPENSWAYIIQASALGHLNRPAEAFAALEKCENSHPGRVNAEFLVRPTQYKDPHEQDHILEGVLNAGWRP